MYSTLVVNAKDNIHYVALFALFLTLLTRSGQFYAKSIACGTSVLFCGLCGIFYGLVLFPLGHRSLVNWLTAREYYFLSRFITGIDVEIEGLENLDKNTPAVIVQNHQSSMDLLPLGAVFPKNCGILAKSELKYYPFLGQFMQLGQSIFVNRGNHSDAVKAMAQAAEDMRRKKMSVWLFPEGTRSRLATADLLPFKKGAFHLAVQAKVPIVPIVVANYMNLYNSKLTHFSPGFIRVRILPPIHTKDRTSAPEDIEALLTETRDLMLEALRQISPPVNGIASKVHAN